MILSFQNYYKEIQIGYINEIKQLDEDEIINEIARISSGEINEATLNYAKELRCKKYA